MMNEQTKGMYTVETKSMLAKLMASENIKVEHRTCKTAGFNLKTRTLICPIWKDMSGDLYDLMMGHEISHALNTPLDGWHDSVTYAGGDKKASAAAQRSFKHFLNVAEDARIEKLVKRQYPGLRRPMINGYKSLLARDFFGLSAISNFNDLYLIDKLNLAVKCGTLVNIHFTAKEKPFYDAMMALETWEQVVVLAKKLFDYSKEEQKKGEEKKKELAEHLKEMNQGEEEEEGDEGGEGEEGDDDEDGEWDEGYNEDEDEDAKDREEGDSDDLNADEDEEDSDSKKAQKEDEAEDEEEGKSSEAKGDKADKDEEKKADDKTTEEKADEGKGKRAKKKDKKTASKTGQNTGEGQSETTDEEFIPKAKTDEAFRNAEDSLVEKSNLESFYVNIPVANLADIVAPASVVNKGLTQFFAGQGELGYRLLNEFKKKNEDYISLLAKEFEMKKAARSYAKAKTADTGDININKLANYRLEDNIFKKMMVVYKGKSHGLVLILDKSGSMSEHIEGAMEQILVMALFCRKVNIPFAAYSFTSTSGCAAEHDFPGRGRYSLAPLKPFSTGPGDLMMNELDLREMFNSKMPASEFSQAIMNHLLMAKGLRNRHDLAVPSHERMGSTPLNEALVALRDIIRNFKKAHRLDIVNAIVVHDGDSDGNREAFSAKVPNDRYHRQVFSTEVHRVTIIDVKEKLQILLPRDSRGMTIGLMKWLQMTADCGVFGFYITGDKPKSAQWGIMGLYQNKQGIRIQRNGRHDAASDQAILLSRLCHQVIDEKFLESYTDGYTRFYFIPGAAELKIVEGTIQDTGKAWTPSRLLSAFKKVNKKKQVSRVLVNRFIELMAV